MSVSTRLPVEAAIELHLKQQEKKCRRIYILLKRKIIKVSVGIQGQKGVAAIYLVVNMKSNQKI